MSEKFNLRDYITCEVCDCIYETPISLSCSTICSKHIIDGKFDCKKCNKQHIVPSGTLIINQKLCHLISIHDKYVLKEAILCENNSKAREICDTLDFLIHKTEILLNDPSYYINGHFSNLKLTIDLEREKRIQMINDHYFRVLNVLEDQERICLENDIENIREETNQAVEQTKNELEKYNSLCEDPNLSDNKKWHYSRNKIEYTIRKLEYYLSKFQNELLLNKDYMIEIKPNYSITSFCALNALDKPAQDEDKLEERILFEIKDFKSFIADRLDRFYDKWCMIYGVPWKFVYEIGDNYDVNENYELVFSAYCIPVCDLEKLRQYPFKAQVTYKILNTNGDVFKYKV